jgi:spore germination cell wall hydrolase CwlJ-like protein
MVAPVDRPRGVLAGTFGVGILTFLLLPSEVGYQDLAALIARDVASVERPQKASLASPFGTIHAANLNLPQPIGSGIQPALGYTLASLDPSNAEITGSIRERILREGALTLSPDAGGPWVDRSRKSDQITVEARKNVVVKGDRLSVPPTQQAKAEPSVSVEAAPQQVAIAPSVEGTAEVAAPVDLEAENLIAAEKQLADAAEQAAQTQTAKLSTPPEADEPAASPQQAKKSDPKSDSKPAPAVAETKQKPTQQAEKPRSTRQASSKRSQKEAQADRDAQRRADRTTREAKQKAEKLPRNQDAPKPAELARTSDDPAAASAPVDVAASEPGQAADAQIQPVESTRTNGFTLASAGDYRIGVNPRQFERDVTTTEVTAPEAPGNAAEAEVADGKSDALHTANAIASAEGTPTQRKSRLFFGGDPMGKKVGNLQPWQPGAAPRSDGALGDVATDSKDSEIKLAALPPAESTVDSTILPGSVPNQSVGKDPNAHGGQSIAPKGEVTGADQRPMTPAERLGLNDEKSRAKTVKCLTEVIYFEARGEVVRGQMAVAQVVLNRAFSGKYPTTVCGVVYQNAHRHLACQFTFACDGIADRIKEPDMWERAIVIANEMLDGKIWLPEIGKATHYHAYWVRPGWVRTMNKLHRVGVHTFYRPRNWGDGETAPQWGDEGETKEVAKKLVEVANKP